MLLQPALQGGCWKYFPREVCACAKARALISSKRGILINGILMRWENSLAVHKTRIPESRSSRGVNQHHSVEILTGMGNSFQGKILPSPVHGETSLST